MTNENLSESLKNLQHNIIGILPYGVIADGRFELITEINKVSVTAISIGSFAGLSESTYGFSSVKDQIILFPGNKTLAQFMVKPFEFSSWFDELK